MDVRTQAPFRRPADESLVALCARAVESFLFGAAPFTLEPRGPERADGLHEAPCDIEEAESRQRLDEADIARKIPVSPPSSRQGEAAGQNEGKEVRKAEDRNEPVHES